jgi:hypothetical protein
MFTREAPCRARTSAAPILVRELIAPLDIRSIENSLDFLDLISSNFKKDGRIVI